MPTILGRPQPGVPRGSVQGGVVEVGRHHRQVAALAAQDRAPQVLRRLAERVAGVVAAGAEARVDDVPGALGELVLQLARAPAGVARRRCAAGSPRRRAPRAARRGRPGRAGRRPGASRAARRRRRPGTRARPSAESSATGPPWKSTPGSVASGCQTGRTSATSTGVGRLITTPSAPSSSWSSTSTTRALEVRVTQRRGRHQQPPGQRSPSGGPDRSLPHDARARATIRRARRAMPARSARRRPGRRCGAGSSRAAPARSATAWPASSGSHQRAGEPGPQPGPGHRGEGRDVHDLVQAGDAVRAPAGAAASRAARG